MTPTNYLRNKEKRLNTLFRIINGEGFYVCKDVLIPEKEFDELHPLPLKIRLPNRNGFIPQDIDGRRAWMND